MSTETDEAKGRGSECLTYGIEEFALKLGVARNTAYAEARSTGAIAGVRVIRIGRLKRLPKAAADRVLRGEPA